MRLSLIKIYAAQNDFDVIIPSLEATIKEICKDGGRTYINWLLSDDAIRTYHAFYCSSTNRGAENKHAKNIHSENVLHVSSYAESLKNVEKRYPHIFISPDRL